MSVFYGEAVLESVLRSAKASLARFDWVVEQYCGGENATDLDASRRSLLYRAQTQAAHGRTEGQIGVLDEIVERFGATHLPRDQTLVAEALVCKSELLIDLGRADSALQACRDLDRRLGALAAEGRIDFEWRTGRVRIKVLLAQRRHAAALDAFRSAYALFNPRGVGMLDGILECVRELVSAGGVERDVEGILSSDQGKSRALAPLVTALRQRTGAEVRAPKEVLEVAEDVRGYLAGQRP